MATLSSSQSFPGPKSQAMLEELGKYVIATPMPFAIDLEQCRGMWLVTVDGQRLFDWAGYFGSKLIGHNHPKLYETEYVKRLVRAANNKVANPDFLTQECLDYYRMIYQVAPEIMRNPSLEVYAVNSGAEAVENMMKYLVAKYNQKRQAKGLPAGNRRFLYFDKAFHGRTVFALGVTETIDPVATKDFRGLTAGGNLMLPFPAFDSDLSYAENMSRADKVLEQVESALRLMRDEIVGIIVEPIQGAGGHRTAVPEFFQGLSRLAHEHDTALAFDEVQTGLGATGKMWALDHFDLPYPPKAVATGKKFGTGIVYMLESLDDVGVLDSTWGGTLADMVRVVQEMKIVQEEGLIDRAVTNGDRLATGLAKLVAKHRPLLKNVRGLGLYQGVSLPDSETRGRLVAQATNEYGLLLLSAGAHSIRTRPNLSVTADEVDLFLELFDKSLADIA